MRALTIYTHLGCIGHGSPRTETGTAWGRGAGSLTKAVGEPALAPVLVPVVQDVALRGVRSLGIPIVNRAAHVSPASVGLWLLTPGGAGAA